MTRKLNWSGMGDPNARPRAKACFQYPAKVACFQLHLLPKAQRGDYINQMEGCSEEDDEIDPTARNEALDDLRLRSRSARPKGP